MVETLSSYEPRLVVSVGFLVEYFAAFGSYIPSSPSSAGYSGLCLMFDSLNLFPSAPE